MDNQFIFDLDDTLIMTEIYYNRAILAFLSYVLERLKTDCPDIPSVARLFEDIDEENFAQMAASGDRFQLSMKTAYSRICANLGINDPDGEEQILKVGCNALDEKNWQSNAFYPGVTETLDYLTLQGDHLSLLTMGDLAVQEGKIRAAGVRRWFAPEDVHICAGHKDAAHMIELAGNYDPRHVFMVGNSIRSDILPACDAGINAIYIPRAPWHFENSHTQLPAYENLWIFKSISDIVDNYAALTGTQNH